jgi:hypothetical protein
MLLTIIIASIIVYFIVNYIKKSNAEKDTNTQEYYNQTIASVQDNKFKLGTKPIIEHFQQDNSNQMLIFNCAGFQYHDADKIDRFKIGDEINLEIDDDNKYDKNAVMLHYKGYLIGYVPHYNALEVREILESDEEYFASIFEYNSKREPYDKLKISIDIL